MKKRRKITTKIGLLLLLFAALAIIVLPFQAWALDDFDNDGILDGEEGLCLPLGAQNCADTELDKPDLFILLVKPPDSLIPEDPGFDLFEFIASEQGAFNINVHEIGPLDAPTQIIYENQDTIQYAIALIERTDATNGDLGTTQLGIANERISGYVFTRRIMNDVKNACELQPFCKVVNEQGDEIVGPGSSYDAAHIQKIFKVYLKNVYAHETFHGLGRVVPRNRKLENHYAQIGKIMDHHMWYKASKKIDTVIWHIETTWADADKPLFK